MRALVESTAFRKDCKHARKRGYDIAKLAAVLRKFQQGEPLPTSVEVRPVPGYTDYRYAVVNNQRLIVDPRTRRVIRVIE